MADVLLPLKSGYEICEFVKAQPGHRHGARRTDRRPSGAVRRRARPAVSSDGVLKKPFEASLVTAAIRPLAEAATLARNVLAESAPPKRTPSWFARPSRWRSTRPCRRWWTKSPSK